jgi:hypothetical protein
MVAARCTPRAARTAVRAQPECRAARAVMRVLLRSARCTQRARSSWRGRLGESNRQPIFRYTLYACNCMYVTHLTAVQGWTLLQANGREGIGERRGTVLGQPLMIYIDNPRCGTQNISDTRDTL